MVRGSQRRRRRAAAMLGMAADGYARLRTSIVVEPRDADGALGVVADGEAARHVRAKGAERAGQRVRCARVWLRWRGAGCCGAGCCGAGCGSGAGCSRVEQSQGGAGQGAEACAASRWARRRWGRAFWLRGLVGNRVGSCWGLQEPAGRAQAPGGPAAAVDSEAGWRFGGNRDAGSGRRHGHLIGA